MQHRDPVECRALRALLMFKRSFVKEPIVASNVSLLVLAFAKLEKKSVNMYSGRRRKIRCIFRAEDPNVCTECFARGSRCRGQQHVETNPQIIDNRPNLRERVAKLEQLLEALQPGVDTKSIDRGIDSSSVDSVGDTERGAAEALSILRADGMTSLPLSTHSQFEYSSNAPLLSVFDHEIVSSEIYMNVMSILIVTVRSQFPASAPSS